MIKEWLKKNKPSVTDQWEGKKLPHIQPSGSLGEGVSGGEKI